MVTMSGLPANPGDTFPAWITTVWPPENLRLLEHQWSVALDYWGDLVAEHGFDAADEYVVKMLHDRQSAEPEDAAAVLRANFGSASSGGNLSSALGVVPQSGSQACSPFSLSLFAKSRMQLP